MWLHGRMEYGPYDPRLPHVWEYEPYVLKVCTYGTSIRTGTAYTLTPMGRYVVQELDGCMAVSIET